MSPRIFVLCLPALAGCLQDVDNGAALGGASLVDAGSTLEATVGLTYADGGKCPPGMVVGGKDGVGGHGVCIPVNQSTPPIALVSDDNPSVTKDPCVATQIQSLEVRKKFCGSCHADGVSNGSFGSVLDDNALVTARSNEMALDDAGRPQRLVIPGDPDHSRLYQRTYQGLVGYSAGMPPLSPPVPRPSVSDCSVLRQWILCLGDGGAFLQSDVLPDEEDAGASDAHTDSGSALDAARDGAGNRNDGGLTVEGGGRGPADGGRG